MSGRKEEVAEKIQEPFEYFAFIEKPFDKKQLVDAIKEAMRKAKERPVTAIPAVTVTPASAPTDSAAASASAAEIEALKAKVEKMQAEIDGLKKQLTQIVTFIKQKIK
jgi:DNA-binding NtrC family response regulator